MTRIRVSANTDAGSWRCPWCLGDADERLGWVVCRNDETPVHAACAQEYGGCPICRNPISSPESTRAELALRIRVTPRASRAADEPAALPLVAPLGDELLLAFASNDAFYEPPWAPLARALGWGVVAVSGLAAVKVSILLALALWGILALAWRWLLRRLPRPHRGAWLRQRASLAAAEVDAAVAADEAARAAAAAFELERGRAQAAQARLEARWQRFSTRRERHEARRRTRRRDELRREVPIDDAQRVHGIGPGITATLRENGVRSLDDLLRQGARWIPGIGPQRARLLETWACDRSEAIERLIQTGPLPGPPFEDPWYEEDLAAIRRDHRAAADAAESHRASLLGWLRARRRRLEDWGIAS